MKYLTILCAALLVSGTSFAHEYKIGNIKISHPFARPTVAAQSPGAAYLRIENTGETADKLLAASSPEAKQVELHSMSMEGDVMKMRAVENIPIGPKSNVNMQPGHGYHLMLMGLKKPLKVGDKIGVQLQFEKAGKLDVSVWVESMQKSDAHAH